MTDTLFKMVSFEKNILILVVLLPFGFSAFAQREKIDSLKKVLPSLSGNGRVDCLNALTETYLKLNKPDLPLPSGNGDTAATYANGAHEEALELNYIHGIAESLSRQGEIANLSENFIAQERLSREAILWYRKTSNKKGLAETYYLLSHALYAESMFPEAITNADTAFELHKINKDTAGMYWAVYLSCWICYENGDYGKSFEFARKSLDIATQTNNSFFKKGVLIAMGSLFQAIEEYETALEYYHESSPTIRVRAVDYAKLFIDMHQYDSAKYCCGLIDTTGGKNLREYLTITGEYYYATKQYDKALPNLYRGLGYHKQKNDRNPVMRTLLDLTKTWLAIGNIDSAYEYGIESLKMSEQTGANQVMREASEMLSSVYDLRHQTDSAYFYYKQFTTIKDSILNNLVKGKLAAYDFDRKTELINKEKQIQQVELQTQSLVKNILIGGIIVLLLLAAIIFRNVILKRRNEKEQLERELELQRMESSKTKAELQQQATELEMQALRAQMNPHFIFNSLNSINRFILQNNRSQASEYLTKFSKLVRMILQNSQASLISLESELESLNLYLDLEAVRFEHRFAYKISYPKDLDIEVLKVPPLVIQPFTENAIWHGLMHKEDKGQLDIDVSEENDYVYIKITDNGIGRKKAAELASKSATQHKSMGLRITGDRIAMLEKANGGESPVKVIDLESEDGTAAGTEVIIKMPAIYD